MFLVVFIGAVDFFTKRRWRRAQVNEGIHWLQAGHIIRPVRCIRTFFTAPLSDAADA